MNRPQVMQPAEKNVMRVSAAVPVSPAIVPGQGLGERLFQPFRLGPYNLPHRIVMAPLTRSRARQPGNVPSSLNACYYAQRASAGLIVSEATQRGTQTLRG
jgi:N-ethylmaleimide reductase